MNIEFWLYVFAALFFGAEAFRVSNPLFSWTPAAFCLLVIALFLV